MDLKQIRYFLNLADTLNFTRAAALSDVSQPALTKSIRRLEEDFGGQLIYRDGKDTRLTELGRTLRGEFEILVATELRARELADEVTRQGKTRLSIGIGETLGPEPIWSFLQSALADLPGADVVLTSIPTDRAESLVLSGTIDACFQADVDLSNPKLQGIPLYRERLMLACARDHTFAELPEIPMRAIGEETYLDRIGCEFRNQVIDHFMDQTILSRPVVQSDREIWIQQAVAGGMGVTMLPEHSGVLDGIVLRQVMGLTLSREVSLLTVFGSGTAPAIRQIRDKAKAFEWPMSTGHAEA